MVNYYREITVAYERELAQLEEKGRRPLRTAATATDDPAAGIVGSTRYRWELSQLPPGLACRGCGQLARKLRAGDSQEIRDLVGETTEDDGDAWSMSDRTSVAAPLLGGRTS
ncbi:hypothetical protein [Streptomyces sp. NPDC048710]|uniref:hypothetical protein n=1 Tax=Streptomyces sp. NPDC048710 TaxID=3365586 RepID=UPI003712EBF2